MMKEKIEGGIKKAKNKTQRIQILALQKSVIKNVIKLCDKRTIIVNAFVNKHIYIGNVEKENLKKLLQSKQN